jgi:hypothetical protein
MTAKKTAATHARVGTERPDRQKRLPADRRGIGAAPQHLPPDVASTWQELAQALPTGVCGPSDRVGFELLARVVTKMRTAHLNAAELAQVRQLLDAFGMSPRGRQQLDVVATKGTDGHPGFEF